jgi:hypothetical protein
LPTLLSFKLPINKVVAIDHKTQFEIKFNSKAVGSRMELNFLDPFWIASFCLIGYNSIKQD